MSSDLIRLGGLWKNEKDGKTYLSGSLGMAKLLIFPNSFKDKDNDPDFILYVGTKAKKDDGGEGGGEPPEKKAQDDLPW